MIQKVMKVGTSAVFTIPKKSLGQLGIKIGDDISVEVNTKDKIITIEPATQAVHDSETITWTRQFIKRYKKTLVALADK
ncbi:MAG: hypothetical protein AAB821_00670 [Patescibacteria group bacterium]